MAAKVIEIASRAILLPHEKFFTKFELHCKCLQGITGDLQGKSAISMEKGCKNHKETLYSSKGKIAYIVEKPCNIYRLRGNPIIIMGFPRNL